MEIQKGHPMDQTTEKSPGAPNAPGYKSTQQAHSRTKGIRRHKSKEPDEPEPRATPWKYKRHPKNQATKTNRGAPHEPGVKGQWEEPSSSPADSPKRKAHGNPETANPKPFKSSLEAS